MIRNANIPFGEPCYQVSEGANPNIIEIKL